jgi:thiol-disulfide isomerase/thioredoxin
MLSIVLLLIVSGLSGQGIVVFKGTVQLDDKEVEVKLNQRTIAAFPVQDDKTFYGEVELDRFIQLSVNHGVCVQPVFAKPGREITIDFGTAPMTAEFSGSPETRLYTDTRFVIGPGDVEIIFKMTWPIFKKYSQNALNAKLRFIDVFCLAYPDIPETWKEEVIAETKYANYGMFINWPQFHKSALGITEFEGEDDWREYLNSLFEKIEWNNTKLRGQHRFVSFAEYALMQEARKSEIHSSFLLNVYDVIDQKIAHPEMKEFFTYQMTNKYLKDETPMTRDEVVAIYRTRVSNQNMLAQIDKIVEDAARFGGGAPAFDFTLEDIHGNMITLSDFVGKVVYIDFWATWCAPCRAEIPHLNKLKEELKGNKDIVIIGVSTDQMRDKGKWRELVAELNMGDYQVFAGEQAAEIQQRYDVRGIPHFVIIGKDGKIYQNKTIRPSNPQTKSVLLNLAR